MEWEGRWDIERREVSGLIAQWIRDLVGDDLLEQFLTVLLGVCRLCPKRIELPATKHGELQLIFFSVLPERELSSVPEWYTVWEFLP